MLFVGDILQLPPVNGTPVVPKKVVSLRLGSIGSVNIWKEAVLYDELTINERQKSDKTYTDLLIIIIIIINRYSITRPHIQHIAN